MDIMKYKMKSEEH